MGSCGFRCSFGSVGEAAGGCVSPFTGALVGLSKAQDPKSQAPNPRPQTQIAKPKTQNPKNKTQKVGGAVGSCGRPLGSCGVRIFKMLRTGTRFSSKFSGCSTRERDFLYSHGSAIFFKIFRMLRTGARF